MKVGFAQQKLKLPEVCSLAGYAAERPMQGIHDDLYVKAIVLENEFDVYALIVFDLLAIDHLIMDQVKARLKQSGLIISNLDFAAIHTHSGCMGILDTQNGCLKSAVDIVGKEDPAIVKECGDKAFAAVMEAYETKETGTLSIARGCVQDVGANRISEKMDGNDHALLIEITTCYKRALVTLYACHPTILPPSNQLCSADLPGAYAKQVKQHYDMSIYLNGSCGDISTRFTRRSSDASELDRMSKLFYAQVRQILQNKEQIQIQSMDHFHFSIHLRAKTPKPLTEAQAYVKKCRDRIEQAKRQGLDSQQLRLVENALEGAEADVRYAKSYDGVTTYEIPISMIRMNDEIFVGIPGELFSSLSTPLQDAHTHFISYCNGYMMYFADEGAYVRNNYEALSSPFEKGESEKMMREIHAQIKKWRKQG